MDRPHRGPAGRAVAGGAPVNAIIEAREVMKSFGQTPALRGATVTVEQGEILAVMGPSGAVPLPQPIVTCVPVGASDGKAASSPRGTRLRRRRDLPLDPV
jgi:hypothetical protein